MDAARQAQDIKDDLSFFRVVLLVFGGVALLVGSFLIFNIFSITVDQRIRTECLCCPPGAPDGAYCAWEFSLADVDS